MNESRVITVLLKDIEESSPTSDTLRSPIYKKMTVLNSGLCPAKQIRIVKNVVENEGANALGNKSAF